MSRTLRLALAAALLTACSGNKDSAAAAADSAAVPNTTTDSMGKTGPIGDSLSPAAPPPTVPPASDTARAPGDTTTRPPR
jgi:ABC-type glycerol-3-phosphate transport system substrate-binding protein